MAAMNGVSAAEFALDMGFSLKKVINLEKDAVCSLAKCGGLTDWQMNELISWTGQRVGDVRMKFRGEIFVSRALRNPIIRGCPVCLREDAEIDPSQPLTQMAFRGDWQLREFALCIKHGHPLVDLWEHDRPTERFDILTRFTKILPEILSGQLEEPRTKVLPYDLWLSTRLETGADETWLANKSLYAATTFCKLLGTELRRLNCSPETDGAADCAFAHTDGFEVARYGAAKIRDAFNALAASADGHNDEPNKAFGQLYLGLSQAHLNKEEFAPFRKILRDCIVDIWPVAVGEDVLGFIQRERQLHSLSTAARETGVGAGLLEQFLVHAGAIAPDDNRPASRKTFDAEANAELLADIPTLVGPREMQQQIGATRRQFVSLVEDNILKPRIDIPTIKFPWRVSDGSALVAELHGMAKLIDPTDNRWEGIQHAKRRTDVKVGAIISAIRARRLQIGRHGDIWGYTGFRVLKSEIDGLVPPKKEMSEKTMISAAVFARSVGMRSEGWFEKLAATGHTPATHMPHPKWGGMRVYVSERDIAEFHKRFLTSTTMEREFGVHKISLLAKLKEAGVRPFAPSGQNFLALYRREDVEAVLIPSLLKLKS
jgi:hypothetical protein